MRPEFTPGPWAWFGYPENPHLATVHGGRQVIMTFQGNQPNFRVEGRLVAAQELVTFEVGDRGTIGLTAAKADHALVGWAMCVGGGRWEPFDDGKGEFCINGFCHYTKLDEFGLPVLTGNLRELIIALQGEE